MTPNPKQNKLSSGPPEENADQNNQEEEQAPEEEEFDDDIEVSLDEFDSVNSYLDSLNSALDTIEQRNDDLKAQLLNLLQSNREIRQSMQEEYSKRSEASGAIDQENATKDAMEQ